MTDVDIAALAKLARLEVSQDEMAKLDTEIPRILEFVDSIGEAGIADEGASALRNVVRADENPHEGGMYTEKLLAAAPAREGNRVVVKQVISRKK